MAVQNAEENVSGLISLVLKLLDEGLPITKQRQKRESDVKRLLSCLERNYDDTLSHCRSLIDQTRSERDQIDQLSPDRKRQILLQNAISYEKLGRESSELGQKEYARDCFERALALVKKAGDCKLEASILNNLGRTYSALGRKEEACHILEEALALAIEVEDHAALCLILNNLGLVYADTGSYTKAESCLKQALIICQDTGVWWCQKSRQFVGKNKSELSHTRKVLLVPAIDLCRRVIV